MAQGTEDSTDCLFGFETNMKDKSADAVVKYPDECSIGYPYTYILHNSPYIHQNMPIMGLKIHQITSSIKTCIPFSHISICIYHFIPLNTICN